MLESVTFRIKTKDTHSALPLADCQAVHQLFNPNSFLSNFEFRTVGFCGERETGKPGICQSKICEVTFCSEWVNNPFISMGQSPIDE